MNAFSCFILYSKIHQNFNTRDNAVGKTPMLVVYPLPDKGRNRYIDNGVGVDCLFRVGRLAMP